MAVALYLRVSTEEQRERQSIATQKEFAIRYCALHQLDIYHTYADDGVSGTVPIEQRLIGRRLLEDAQQRRFEQLLVFKLDRLGRDTRLILNVVAELEKQGVRVRSMTEEFDTATSTGRLMLTLLSGFAAHERELIRERSMAGSSRLAATGAWLGGVVPYGYRKQGERSAARLVVSEDPIPGFALTEAEIVQTIYRMSTTGKQSCQRIADHFNRLGVPTPSNMSRHRDGGQPEEMTPTPWRPSQVRNMIINRVYMGQHVFGKRSRNRERKPISRSVPPLVSESVWKQAQQMLRSNQSRCARPGEKPYLLSGLIECGVCGLSYSGKKKGPPQNYYYQCNGRLFPKKLYGLKGQRCTAKSLHGVALENLIGSDLDEFVRKPERVLEQLKQQLVLDDRERPLRQQQLAALDAQQEEKMAERDRVLALFRRGRIDDETLDWQLDLIQAETIALQKEIEILKRLLSISDPAAQLATAAENLHSLVQFSEYSQPPARWRALVERLVESIQANTVERNGLEHSEIVVRYRFNPPEESGALILTRRHVIPPRSVPAEQPSSLGDCLRQRRLRLKMSQRQLAEHLGAGRASIYKWEHNQQKPELQSLQAIVAFLGYNPIPDTDDWSQRLVQARMAQGLSQKDTASRMGVCQSTLARWERGEREPAGEFATRAARFLASSGLCAANADRI